MRIQRIFLEGYWVVLILSAAVFGLGMEEGRALIPIVLGVVFGGVGAHLVSGRKCPQCRRFFHGLLTKAGFRYPYVFKGECGSCGVSIEKMERPDLGREG